MPPPEEPGRAAIEGHLVEERVYRPPPGFIDQANARDPGVYDRAARAPEEFWAGFARELTWFRPWERALKWEPPHADWFAGGKTNAAFNCLDRHLARLAEEQAIVWEGEDGSVRKLTYAELTEEVCRFANGLKRLGVRKGDRVAVYLPMIPEAAVAMLACARIGAVHSVVFAGFSPKALRDRVADAGTKVLVTADGYYRRGEVIDLKGKTDEALAGTSPVEKVVVIQRFAERAPPMTPERDVFWSELRGDVPSVCVADAMDAEDPLFILYTSGTTGKPKGVLHTMGGYLTGAYATTKWTLDLKPADVHFCTADVGWITGHSYIVYGPLLNGATVVMYEGAPDWPDKDRFWEMVARHEVNVFYTAPTAIRAFMKWGAEYPRRHDLSSLRLIGSVGEPLNPEAWVWYHDHVGEDRCPVVDTWWQTETGMIMISTLPGVDEMRPGYAGKPFPGTAADVVDENGNAVTEPGAGGYLVLTRPWPAMFRTLWKNPEGYVEKYWERFFPDYFPADGAKRDAHGYYMVLGRVDDVMNVSGHRLSSMEVESALVNHPAVAEAAVVGRHDPATGQCPVAFVVLRRDAEATQGLPDALRAHVAREIGPIARPGAVVVVPDLPKTRSGKIMRRLLRNVAEGQPPGDATTLADPTVMNRIVEILGGR